MRTFLRLSCRFVGFLFILVAVVAGTTGRRQDRTAAACPAAVGVLLFIPFRKRRQRPPSMHTAGYAAALEAMQADPNWRFDPATARQKSFADELGIDYHDGITKGELSDRITAVTGR